MLQLLRRRTARAYARYEVLSTMPPARPSSRAQAEANADYIAHLAKLYVISQQKNTNSPPPQRRRLCEILSQQPQPKYSPQALARICFAIATGGLAGEIPSSIIAQLDEERVSRFDPSMLANTLWSFATLESRVGGKEEAVLEILCKHCLANAERFTVHDIARTLWSLAKLNFNHEQVFARFERQLLAKEEETNNYCYPHAVSMICWSFACVGRRAPELFATLARCVVARPAFFSKAAVDDMIDLLSSFSVLGETCHVELFQHIHRELANRRPLLSESELQRIATTFTLLNLAPELPTLLRPPPAVVLPEEAPRATPADLAKQFHELAQSPTLTDFKLVQNLCMQICQFAALPQQQQSFTDGQVGMICCALAKLKSQHPLLFEIPSQRFASQQPAAAVAGSLLADSLQVFACLAKRANVLSSPNALAMAIWSHASFGVVFPRAWLGPEFTNWDKLTPRQMATILQSCAILQQRDALPLGLICNELLRRKWHGFSLWDLSCTLWSLACLDVLNDALVRQVICSIPSSSLPDNGSLNEKDAQQLCQAKLAWRLCNPFLTAPIFDDIPFGDLLPKCAPETQTSKIQSKIFVELKKLFKRREEIVLEYVPPECGGGVIMVVDIYFKTRRCAVEVNGPKHYLADGKTLVGNTVFKTRLLERCGITCLHVHAQEFANATKQDQLHMLEELKQKIKSV